MTSIEVQSLDYKALSAGKTQNFRQFLLLLTFGVVLACWAKFLRRKRRKVAKLLVPESFGSKTWKELFAKKVFRLK